jgi:hypothetical protein
MPITDSRLLHGTLVLGDVAAGADLAVQATNIVIEQADGDTDDVVTTLSGDTTGGGTTEGPWHITGTMIQDFDSTDASVQQWTYLNRGTEQPFTFTPNDKSQLTISGNVSVKFLGIGGDTNARITRDFDWSIPEEPLFTWGGAAVAATGATAGTPGTFTPAGAAAPPDAAGVGALVASPNTAWTTGQYVQAADATQSHWDGSAWAAGPAA